MSKFLPVALFSCLCAFVALGETVDLFEPEPRLKTLFPEVEEICGEPEVWRRLTADSSFDGVQNIKWAKIDKLMEDHLWDRNAKISSLESQIKSLDEQIAKKMLEEEAQPMPVSEMSDLIENGLHPFGELRVAQDSLCGKPSSRPRAPAGARRQSPEHFRELAEGYFGAKKVRCDGDAFLKECHRMLPQGSTPYESNCPTLCQKFTDIAVKISDETAGETAGESSEDLAKERQQKVVALTAAKADVSSCKTAREFITGLGQQISKQKEEIEVRFEKYQDAEENLASASYDLEDVVSHLELDSLALKKAEEALKQSEADMTAVEADVATLEEKEKGLLAKLSALTAALEAARVRILECQTADEVVNELRQGVATVSSQMRMLFFQAALVPLDKMGLGTERDTQELLDDVETFKTSTKLLESLMELREYCDTTAARAFKAAAHLVPTLNEMCDFGEPDEVYQELAQKVTVTKTGIKKRIDNLLSWHNPLKGQSGMSPDRVKEFVTLGEPKNLRATVGVYSETNFFRMYLKEWTLKGEFLKLIAQLRGAIETADASFKELNDQWAPMVGDIEAAKKEKEKAMEALKTALEAVAADEEARDKLQESVDALTANRQALEDDYSRLLAELEKAKKMWDESKEELLSAYHKATSFLQSHTEEGSTLLAMAVEQSKHELAMAHQVLRDAEDAVAMANASEL